MPFWSIEPILQKLRFLKIYPSLPKGGVLVDIGCNSPPYIISQICEQMDFCIGIDASVEDTIEKNVELKKYYIKRKVPVESDLANVVTMLAVLEHLEFPQAVINECFRILKPGGLLLITVPSKLNHFPLLLLARLGIVHKEMINQHKNYFNHHDLKNMLERAGFRSVVIKSFQFGLNIFVRALK